MNENENFDKILNIERNDIEIQNKVEDVDKMVEVINSKIFEYFLKGLMIKGLSEFFVIDVYGVGRDLVFNS